MYHRPDDCLQMAPLQEQFRLRLAALPALLPPRSALGTRSRSPAGTGTCPPGAAQGSDVCQEHPYLAVGHLAQAGRQIFLEPVYDRVMVPGRFGEEALDGPAETPIDSVKFSALRRSWECTKKARR